ncbi:HAD family hydrolase [Propioniciclava sp.]|uniref:HAD family hydrolase n=1 Tax=Propioniciclava sp. TaxID=2038686 RepID=UPI00262D7A24|nr:HAD family hydrolase [Propioniciclava sp.]
MIRLIATDVDETLIQSDHHTISARTRAAFAAAVDAGITVTAISGRQPYSIAALVEGTVLAGPAIGSNGSVAMNLVSGELYFEELIDVDAQTTLARAMAERCSGLLAVSVRNGGNLYVAQHGYVGQQDPGAQQVAWPVEHRWADLSDVLAEPSVKLVLKHPTRTPDELYAAARELAVPGCHPTISGADFLEVAREGVTKASGLAKVCAHLGIEASEVVAFGDNINDVEMLTWAGHGVAMGNARPEARAAADEVTLSNDDDGVAVVIERLLG